MFDFEDTKSSCDIVIDNNNNEKLKSETSSTLVVIAHVSIKFMIINFLNCNIFYNNSEFINMKREKDTNNVLYSVSNF